jgi:glycosyl hydrolase family 114
MNEQCWQYAECITAQNGAFGLDQFVDAGKPVLHVEYELAPKRFFPRSNRENFNSLRKRPAPGPYRVPCRGS